MNLLEHYIINVYSVKIYDKNDEYIVADLEYNCHGYKKRTNKIFLKNEWSNALKKGYYMG